MGELLGNSLSAVNAVAARLYTFRCAPNGSSAPTGLKGQGVTSVSYVTGSIYKFQLDDSNFGALLYAEGCIQAAAGGSGQGFDFEIDATNTNLANGTIAFASCNGSGTRADIAGDANCMAYFTVMLSKNPLDT